jgi:hypothetical protein
VLRHISATNGLLATTDISYVIPKYVKSLGYTAAEVCRDITIRWAASLYTIRSYYLPTKVLDGNKISRNI